MRLGNYDCHLKPGTLARNLYKKPVIQERHRHRYEFNNKFLPQFEADQNLRFSGVNPQLGLVEIVELNGHPFFIACQFHPEFKSRPNKPHPLFAGLVRASGAKK